MSTILKTLKKLEKEKSVLEQSIDLKGMVLHGEDLVIPSMDKARSSRLSMTLILAVGGLLVGIYMFHVFSRPNTPPPPAASPPAKVETQRKQMIVPEKEISRRNAGHQGVSLAGIAEIPAKASPSAPLVLDDDPEAMDLVESPPMEEEISTAEDEERLQTMREIQQVLRNAKIASLKPPREVTVDPYPKASEILIPGLRVKGIISLGADNPVNYILVSTPEENNLKLRVGETILNATLKSIQPNRAIFTYKGKIAVMQVGE